MMGILILAVFTVFLVVVTMIANHYDGEDEEETIIEEAGDYNSKTANRLYYLEKYIELLQSDYTLGKISQEDYEREKKALQRELHAIGTVTQLEDKQAYTSPEIDEMGKLADDFFGSARKDK